MINPTRQTKGSDDFKISRMLRKDFTAKQATEVAELHDLEWTNGPFWRWSMPKWADNATFYVIENKHLLEVVGFGVVAATNESQVSFTKIENGLRLNLATIGQPYRGLGLFSELVRLQLSDAVRDGVEMVTAWATSDIVAPTIARRLKEMRRGGLIKDYEGKIEWEDLGICLEAGRFQGEMEIKLIT